MDRETAELRRKAVEFMKEACPLKDEIEGIPFAPGEVEDIAKRLLDPKAKGTNRKTRTGVRFGEICRRMLKGETIGEIAGPAYANALAKECLMGDIAEAYAAPFGFFANLEFENAERK